MKDFTAAYGGLSFDTESTPAASIIGRMYREFTKKKVSVMSLSKMRSEADAKHTAGRSRRKLTEDITLQIDVEDVAAPDTMRETCIEVLWRLQLMTNGWAMTGVEEVDVPEGLNARVGKTRMCHLTEAMAYHQFVARKAAEHPGPEQVVVSWLLERDRQTRSKARSLLVEGLPWGMALRAARESHCLVLWNVGLPGIPQRQLDSSSHLRDRSPVSRSPHRQRDRRDKGKGKGKDQKKDKFCVRFNGKRGCTKKEKDCPDHGKHACSRCGDWRHGAAHCPK